MLLLRCVPIVFAIDACILSIPVHADNTTRPLRVPNDAILRAPEADDPSQAMPTSAMIINAVTPTELPTESDYGLDGIRSKESPAGKKTGRYCLPGFLRSGFPQCVGRFAMPSITCAHRVGYVGGSTVLGGENRRAHEGTFGFDYSGRWFHRMTWLHWSHGSRYQGGAGRYQTEGPHLFPE
jgi:hypothetical protein